ncbi:MAG TPA: PP2C family serine/threonine-protein phosphatase [Anaerolineae bacterium]|nr:PP2C family serine/threonine-protein phosphatase [Anaerolineae bacterium]
MVWQAIGASVQGTSHIRAGIPCQDAHGHRILGHCAIAAVADGLGSASKAAEAAKQVVEVAMDTLAKSLVNALPSDADGWIKTMREVFAYVRQALEQTALSDALPLRDYGTTLIVTVVTQDWLAVGHIGDGAVVALFADDTLSLVSSPQRGEYANETIPLTAPDALTLAHFSVFQSPVKAVALLTDGLQNLSLNLAAGTPFAPFFAPFFEVITQTLDSAEASRQLAEFLGSERVCARTDDDKTLVVVGKGFAYWDGSLHTVIEPVQQKTDPDGD